MNLSLHQKRALVCGSSQGIGLAIAQELALLGADCLLLARDADKLQKAVASLHSGEGQKHSYHAIDFNDHEATKALVAQLSKENIIHILINNSGGPATGPIAEATPGQFLQAFNQHLITNHIMAQGVMEGMKGAGYGRIINIISTSVKIPLNNLGVSNTTRGAVASWAKTLSNELGSFGITVNNVLPGFARTQRLSSLIENTAAKKGMTTEEVEKGMKGEVPAARFGEPSEIAAMAAFLATPAAAYVNGTSIRVDGGRTGSI